MAPVALDTRFRLSDEAVFRELNGEAVILDLSSGTYFGLNAVGTRIWQLLNEHGRLDAVLDAMCSEYDADRDVLERDLLELAGRLADARLIVMQ